MYSNNIGNLNLLDDFEPVSNLVIVRNIDFLYRYTNKSIDLDSVKNNSCELTVCEVIKKSKLCDKIEIGDKIIVDMVMLSQFYYIFEKHVDIDPDLMIVPENLIQGIIYE